MFVPCSLGIDFYPFSTRSTAYCKDISNCVVFSPCHYKFRNKRPTCACTWPIAPFLARHEYSTLCISPDHNDTSEDNSTWTGSEISKVLAATLAWTPTTGMLYPLTGTAATLVLFLFFCCLAGY